jgi:GNAT superfamily N-acetyltransferase
MSNAPWENLNVNINDFTTSEWSFLESRFIKLGTPGFTQVVLPVKAPHMVGHDLTENVKFDLYRGEDGQLLCVYGTYIKAGVQKPFILMVHPDYQRQGIATIVLDHSREEFVFEKGYEYNLNEGLNNVNTTQAAASWAKKYIENIK